MIFIGVGDSRSSQDHGGSKSCVVDARNYFSVDGSQPQDRFRRRLLEISPLSVSKINRKIRKLGRKLKCSSAGGTRRSSRSSAHHIQARQTCSSATSTPRASSLSWRLASGNSIAPTGEIPGTTASGFPRHSLWDFYWAPFSGIEDSIGNPSKSSSKSFD